MSVNAEYSDRAQTGGRPDQMPQSRADLLPYLSPGMINSPAVLSGMHPYEVAPQIHDVKAPTGFDDGIEDEQLIPGHDTPSFLQGLATPGSLVSDMFRPAAIGKLEDRLARTFLDSSRPTIGFESQLYHHDPSVIFGFDEQRFAVNYTLFDSSAFWNMLDTRPGDFQTNCLTSVQLSIIGATRDLLIARGYDSDAIDERLTGMVFQGQETELRLDGKLLRPFALYNTDQVDDTAPQTFSQIRKAEIIEAHDETGYLPSGIIVNAHLMPGDMFVFSSIGVDHFHDFGNADNQNGIITATVWSGSRASDIGVFTHMSDLAARSTTLGGILRSLSNDALKRKITMEEYLDRGGVGFLFARFDYPGFYAALAKSLSR